MKVWVLRHGEAEPYGSRPDSERALTEHGRKEVLHSAAKLMGQPLTAIYASFEGLHKFTQQAQVEYLLAFHDYSNDADGADNRRNYGAIVRPMYWWNDVHSTWLEAGYQRVDYDQGGDNHGWKLTLSQNISIAMGPEFRPMLRFYVTGGEVDNKHTARVNGTDDDTQLDSFNVGAMWEAWF